MPTTYTGTNGNDIIIGDNNGDVIYGIGGDDQLIGGTGDDTLDGGTGHDILSGGPGHDILTGGPDSDIYRGTAANLNGDEITNFKVGDRIQITDLAEASANIGTSGNALTYGIGDSVTIDNLGPGRLVLRPISNTGTEIRLQENAHNDFNGDGHSDILWEQDGGLL